MRVLRSRAATSPAGAGSGPALESWSAGEATILVGVPVHDGVSTADIVVPGTVLADTLGASVRLLARNPGTFVGVEPSRTIVVTSRMADVASPDIVLIPGGVGWRAQADDQRHLDWLRVACRSAMGVLCVSTGSLLLAAAGVLDGEDAAGHWLAHRQMADLGANPVADRIHYSTNGRIVTASGALAAGAAAKTLIDRLGYGPPDAGQNS
ncbi:MAG: DJ-1/PfpI family protein [Acidimicrobiales bacterium]